MAPAPLAPSSRCPSPLCPASSTRHLPPRSLFASLQPVCPPPAASPCALLARCLSFLCTSAGAERVIDTSRRAEQAAGRHSNHPAANTRCLRAVRAGQGAALALLLGDDQLKAPRTHPGLGEGLASALLDPAGRGEESAAPPKQAGSWRQSQERLHPFPSCRLPAPSSFAVFGPTPQKQRGHSSSPALGCVGFTGL